MDGNRIQELANPNQSHLLDLPATYLSILFLTMDARPDEFMIRNPPFRSRWVSFLRYYRV